MCCKTANGISLAWPVLVNAHAGSLKSTCLQVTLAVDFEDQVQGQPASHTVTLLQHIEIVQLAQQRH